MWGGRRYNAGMIGFKVLTKDGWKGPFQKVSVIKAITSAEIPLQARLHDLERGVYLSAAELVGEETDTPDPPPPDDYDVTMKLPESED